MANPFLVFPRAALVVTALAVVPLLAPLRHVRVNTETRTLLGGDQRNLESYEQVRAILGNTDVVVVSLDVPDLFSPAGLAVVRRISGAFAAVPGVVDVRSLTHSVRPVRRGLTFDMVPLVSLAPDPAELAELRRFCLSHPLVRNLLVADDARHTLIVVTLEAGPEGQRTRRRLRAVVDEVLSPFRAAGLATQVLALPLIEDEIRASLVRDATLFLPAALVWLTIVLWLTFRSVRLVVFVLLNQALALAVLPGLVTAAGFGLNPFTVLLLPLLTGIHLTLLAHLVTAFQWAAANGADPGKAVAEAWRLTAVPCLFATLTTIIGLLSFLTCDVAPIREFGVVGALGLATVHALTFGPALAMLSVAAPRGWLPVRSGSRAQALAREARWAGALAAFVERRRWLVFGVAVWAVVAIGFGLPCIRTDIRAVEFLSPKSPTRQAVEEMDRVWGGINVVQIEVDSGAANGVNRLEFLRYLDAVHRYAESLPELSATYSYAQLMAMINQIWAGGDAAALRLPDSPLLVNLFVVAMNSYEFPFLAGLADPSFRTAQLVLRSRDQAAGRYLEAIRKVVEFAERTRPAGVRVSAAAGVHSLLEADRRIIRSQVTSAGFTAAAIWLTLALLWRSGWLGALTLLANLLPVALVIALAGWLDLPLNAVTVMVAAVSLGVAVDNSIHFTSQWRELRRAGLPPADAVRETLRIKGRAIVWTYVILIGLCAVFGLSSFPPVVHFGWLSALGFFGALGAVFGVLPAVLGRSWRRPQPATSSPSR